MNEKIKELAIQAGQGEPYHIPPEFVNKFAELIIQECANVADDDDVDMLRVGRAIKEHFGVEE